MKAYMSLFLLVILIIVIFSCDNDNMVDPGTKNGYFYPLDIGNQWKYSRTFSMFNFRSNNPENDAFADTTITSSVIVEVVKQEIIQDSVNTYVLQEILAENNQTFIDESYYANSDSGLYFYAYRGAGYVLPKMSSKYKILFRSKYFNTVQEITSYIIKFVPQNYFLTDSLIYENPPLQSLKYPITVNSQWIYRFTGKPWQIDKKILDYELIDVPAGQFNCYKIQWLIDINNDAVWDTDIEFFDYVCEKGLIKRSILYTDQVVFGEDGSKPLGLVDCKDESVLTELSLK